MAAGSGLRGLVIVLVGLAQGAARRLARPAGPKQQEVYARSPALHQQRTDGIGLERDHELRNGLAGSPGSPTCSAPTGPSTSRSSTRCWPSWAACT